MKTHICANNDARSKLGETKTIIQKAQRRWMRSPLLALGALILWESPAHAEGVYQMGLAQFMTDIPVGTTDAYIKIDIVNAGEVINLNACGGSDTDDIQFTVFDSNLVQLDQATIVGGTVSCTDAMDSALTNSYQYTPGSAGIYYVSVDNLNASILNRYDFTVTSNASVNPDPTGATGLVGRVSAEVWRFNTGSYDETTSTDANYYILTPGGFNNTNYVWELDLNNFAGYVYDLKANDRGVDAPNSGFSTPRTGNAVTQLYPIYINYPNVAMAEPTGGPNITNFRFIDDEGQDSSISPGGTTGVQDSGTFEFTSDAIDSTYAIYIDVNQDGIFGNVGDVQLNGQGVNGLNSVYFDGNDNNGNPLAEGVYQAQLGVRLGEFHFIANDAETSGGGANATGSGDGLTVFRATPGGSVPTAVYWDDVTILGATGGGTSTVPGGEMSGTPGAYHTWGDFTGTSFGNNRYIDTYVYGATTYQTSDLAVTDNDNYTTGTVDITDTSVPGDDLTITVTDMDQNLDSGAPDTVSVTIVNDVTGEVETITLTETGDDTGIFTALLPTTYGPTSGPNNNGTMTTKDGDTVTVTYNDPNNVLGNPQALTDTNIVSGGNDGTVTITPSSTPGDTLVITVMDADLVGAGTIDTSVTNPATGETDIITLTESSTTPGLFEGTVDTTFGTTAGTPGDGVLNTQNTDTVVVTYADTMTAAGPRANLTATDTVSGGSDGIVTITPSSTPGDTLDISVTDTDLIGTGTVNVSVSNPATGETETITLTESTTTPGLFDGTIDTAFGITQGTNNDGALNTQNTDTVVVTYIDTHTEAGGTDTRQATDMVSGGNSGVVSITPTSYPGDTLDVTVSDADLIGTGTLDVTVTNPTTGETETVTLTESLTTPGLFEGTVDTAYGTTSGSAGDGSLNTQDGDTVIVTYDDTQTASGGTANLQDTDRVSGGVTGVVTITPTAIPGDPLIVTVTDGDLSGNGTVLVTLVNSETGEMETLTLTESPTTPGIFTAELPTVFGTSPGPNNDGTINADAGDTIIVTYEDAVTQTGQSASPTDTALMGGQGDAVVTITPESTPGDVLTVTLVDNDLTGTGTVQVSITNEGTGEQETITLTQSPTTPGLFEGTIDTQAGPTSGTHNDGTLNTSASDTVSVTYVDPVSSTGGPNTITASDSVLGLSVLKTATLNDGGDGFAHAGDTLTYTFTVTNLSNVAMTNVSISDPLVSVDGGPLSSLAAGATDATTFTATYILTNADIDAASVTNTASATATSPSGTRVTAVSDDPNNADNIDPDGDGQPSDPTVTALRVETAPVAEDDTVSTYPGTPVTLDPRGNDTDPNDDPLTVTTVSDPAEGTVVINPDNTVTITPHDNFVGDFSVVYTVCDSDGNCDTANIVVNTMTPVANVQGIVFLDMNTDDAHQSNEPLEHNWIVEAVLEDGSIWGTTATDQNGAYTFTDMPVTNANIRFRNPDTNTVFGMIENVVLTAGETTFDQNLPIDPSGIVYDSRTRQPLGGVVLTLLDVSGAPLPALCFIDPSQQAQTTDPEGLYRFDVIPGANPACPASETEYRLDFDAPDTHLDTPSTLIPGIATPLNPPAGVGPFAVAPHTMAPTLGETTDYYLEFVLGQGDRDVINNHIPVDDISLAVQPLSVTKFTPQTQVSVGDLIPYTITVTNTENLTRFNLDLVDRAPAGFKYVDDTARINGDPVRPDVDGREIVFRDWTLGPNESVTIDMIFIAGSAVTQGRFVNQAFVRHGLGQDELSGIAEATITFAPSPIFDCSEVIGKVFDDKNGDGYQTHGEPGLAGVNLVTAKGLIITTDEHGRYHITCAQVPNATIGSNFILKIDPRSLPTGYRITTENPRTVRLTRGKMTKANFGASIMSVVTLDLSGQAFMPTRVHLNPQMHPQVDRLISVLRGQQAVLRINYHDDAMSPELADQRMSALTQHLQSRWKQDGGRYELTIEQKIINIGGSQTGRPTGME